MENVTKIPTSPEDEPPKRGASTIKFPYSDLKESERLAATLFENGGVAEPQQLGAWMGHGTINSGAFRNKVSAARIFGLIESVRGQISLTALGKQIAAPHTAPKARVAAFLAVPLYKLIYDDHKDGQLPPDSGLEMEMVRHGVTASQVQNARQVFQRSADHAGFLAVSRDRLVLPAIGTRLKPESDPVRESDGDKGGKGDEPPPPPPLTDMKLPKIIDGILEEAPWGQTWNEEEFVEWVDLFRRAARVHFKLPQRGGE